MDLWGNHWYHWLGCRSHGLWLGELGLVPPGEARQAWHAPPVSFPFSLAATLYQHTCYEGEHDSYHDAEHDARALQPPAPTEINQAYVRGALRAPYHISEYARITITLDVQWTYQGYVVILAAISGGGRIITHSSTISYLKLFTAPEK